MKKMIKFFKEIFDRYIFISYCTQRIFFWPKNTIDIGVIHLIRGEFFIILTPFFTVPYTYFFNDTPKYLFALPIIIPAYISYVIIEKYFEPYLMNILPEIKLKYERVTFFKKTICVIITFTLFIFVYLFFIFSFRILNYIWYPPHRTLPPLRGTARMDKTG